VNLLLDTHIALWAVAGSKRLPRQARDLISDPTNAIFVSAASLWEIAIKHALRPRGPNAMMVSAAEAFGHFTAAGYASIAITPQHTLALESVPHLHSDPFDRILQAQALTEPLRLVTHEPRLAAYGSAVVHV
jgi:PIN domain nuclease of toxin-antitoxin system